MKRNKEVIHGADSEIKNDHIVYVVVSEGDCHDYHVHAVWRDLDEASRHVRALNIKHKNDDNFYAYLVQKTLL